MQNPYDPIHEKMLRQMRRQMPTGMRQPPTPPPPYSPGAMPAGMNLPLAMAWFADQQYGATYDPEKALAQGTLFPELDKPWLAPQRRYTK